MSGWIIASWVGVGILTGINIFLFLKLKSASEQMMKMAFPNAKNMQDAMSQMQNQMKHLSGGTRRPGMPHAGGSGGNMDAQLKAAMDMLQKIQQQNKR